ncbi:MAG: type 1 glutamine amidotransferase domain-containing protein, partial [Enterococcus sp.]
MKVLIVLTNTTHYGETDDATGLWLGEATEFAAELQKHGI